ncbi:hypothetical protein [Ruminococcus flavefaciens]|uniref:Uncharacterized protein n=1 Tax=Ruminococcus flavefaciens TaxID=1265 RepID=A0A1K1NBM2_RUMFL|nr:hypothetical protein [Ruminococcus flavefaciens]SFW32673.1 hypothetical protein SAMN02910280_1793 [Ruminococcus flavefaciens]
MGKYDIGAKLTNECKLTIKDLAEEIADEIDKEIANEESVKKLPFPDGVVQALKDSKGSGLVNKLNTRIHFDVEKIASSSKDEKFQMLKLLKELYWIEKFDISDYVNKSSFNAHGKVKFTDVLAKPRMSNVYTYYSESYSVYGDIFNELIADLRLEVDDADDRKTIIENIEMFWQTLSAIQYDYVISDMAIDDPDMALKELKRINNALDNLLDKIDSKDVHNDIPSEGIMKTFYNILLSHERLCYEFDRIRLSEFNDVDINPSQEYIDLFKQYQEIPLSISSIPSLAEYPQLAYDSNAINDIFKLFSYCQEITDEDFKKYKYAFENFETVLRWIEKEKEGMDFSSEVQIGILVPVIQEIVYVSKHSNSYDIPCDYFDHTERENSLLSAIKKRDDELKPGLVDIWVRRIDTRFSCNLGLRDLIMEKNKAEVKMFKLKEYIFSIHNMKYLKAAHEYLFHQAAIAHTNTNTTIVAEDKLYFLDVLQNLLRSNEILISVFHNDSSILDDMFRELMSEYSTSIKDTCTLTMKLNEIAHQIAESIIDANKKSEAIPVELSTRFFIEKRDGSRRECLLSCTFDKNSKKLYANCFGLVYTDEEKALLSTLGLKI